MTHRAGRRRRAIIAALCAVGLLLPAGVGQAAGSEFPAGYEAYHTYAETVAAIDAAVARYPNLVRKFSIGRSYEGRPLWAAKISDNVGVDENEPEAVFDSLVHGREHLTVEMNLYVLRMLTDGYATSSRIRSIVDSREIFLVFMLNPDGGEYDISGGSFRKWRKNRQPTPDSTAIGTDPNRNFGFKWGCCGGSSGSPSKDTYRGPARWSTPEATAYRDFVRSRVVNGRQQIRVAITWHSSGELILYPYGYTTTDVPKTMTADDHRTYVALAGEMAQRNGYTAIQSSSLYITDGDQKSWTHYAQRIFMFTFELGPGESVNFYPPADQIGQLTSVNRGAVLYLLEQADCPYRAAGLGATHCGPLNDDFEINRGWKVNAAGTDTATSGRWQRAIPKKTTTAAGVKQKAATRSGQADLVTGAAAGGSASANDVDGGITSVLSPPMKLGSGSWTLSFGYYFAHDRQASASDFLRVRVVAGSTRTTIFAVAGAATERNAAWSTVSRRLDAYAGQTIRLLIEAGDVGAASLIEAAVDDVRVYRTPLTADADSPAQPTALGVVRSAVRALAY
ncbi:MAG: M14 family metallopeptidase [Chloroflexota bacterium]|nr:M14 family metallopeptidase [Chloroflexota bacterium]